MRNGVVTTITIIYTFHTTVYIVRIIDHTLRRRARTSSHVVTETAASDIIGIAPIVACRQVLAVVKVQAPSTVWVCGDTSITRESAVVLIESCCHAFALTFFLAPACMRVLVANLVFSHWAGGAVGSNATLYACEVVVAVA